MFAELKQQVKSNFDKLATSQLFYVSIDRDKVWEEYLSGFPEGEVRQSNNCNCCKSFLRQWGGVVAIKDNKVISIWDDIDSPEEYAQSVKNLRKYIHSLPVTDIFVNEFASCGTDSNYDMKRQVTWTHFHVVLPTRFTVAKDTADSIRGTKRASKDVLKRSLDELTIDATESVLELIAQGSIYRGAEFEGMLKEFLRIQNVYSTVPADLKDNFCWAKSTEGSDTLNKIRNSAIGTLLIDVSAGLDLNVAVDKFERVMAPANYKRPTALVTPRMVEDAKKTLNDAGLLDSLERRYANEADLNINDILFIDKSTSVQDVFDEMAKGTIVNPKSFSKVEAVTIKDFINNILPTAKSIEFLLENGQMNNMVSLLTAANPASKNMFKWENSFSWNYTGNIADSMKERVKAAGGNVDGVLRFSIQWNESGQYKQCDLDAHAYEPGGAHIHFGSGFRKDRGNVTTPMSGILDVDMINPPGVGVENITWTDQHRMKDGVYKFSIHNYNGGRNDGFQAQIEFNGEIHEFGVNGHVSGTTQIAEVTLKGGVFSIKPLLESKSNISSKEKWNIKTNQFHRVKQIMLSPNHWGENKAGNKHYIFILEDCVSDESPRPFFNEFLRPEFDVHRKVFETLGSKLKVPHTNNQLSGVGFSETQSGYFIVNVTGQFKRTLKVEL